MTSGGIPSPPYDLVIAHLRSFPDHKRKLTRASAALIASYPVNEATAAHYTMLSVFRAGDKTFVPH